MFKFTLTRIQAWTYIPATMEKLLPVIKTIKDETERIGWSVEDLGAASDVPFQTIYRIFNGESSPNVKTLNKMMNALKMKLAVVR